MVYFYNRAEAAYPGDKIFFWFLNGGSSYMTPVLPTGWTLDSPSVKGYGSLWHKQWAWEVTIPENESNGDYNITAGAETIPVTVVTRPVIGQVVRVAPGGNIQAALNRGTNNVELLPGVHRISSPITVPDGAHIFGTYGTLIERWKDSNPSNQEHNPCFLVSGAFTLEGITLTHASNLKSDSCRYLWSSTWDTNTKRVTVSRCYLRGGRLGFASAANMLVEDCIFDKATSDNLASGAVWLRNTFKGATRGQHPVFTFSSTSSLLLASNRFYGTVRGMVFQGPNTRNSMIMDSHFDGIWGGNNNANECILFESGTGAAITPSGENGARNNTFVDTYIINSAGPGISLYGSGMHDNLFWNNTLICDSYGIILNPVATTGTPQIDNTSFTNTVTSGAIKMIQDVGDVSFENLSILERVQSHGNQDPQISVIEARNQGFPFTLDDATKASNKIAFSNAYYNSFRGREQILSQNYKPTGGFPWR